MEWGTSAAILIGGLLFMVLIGVPVAVSLGLISFTFLIFAAGFDKSLTIVSTEFFKFWTTWTLLPIPLFVLMGEFLFAGGQASDIFDMASKWLKRLPGGLALATIGAGALFATMTGSSLGSCATFSVLAIPEMLKRGYSKRLACGSVSAAGGLAHLIPPSVMAVVYAGLLDLSLGRQLMAGFIPGFMVAASYILVCVIWAKSRPGAAPAEASVTWKDRLLSLKAVGAVVVIVAAVLVSIYVGVATVTEAAGLGAFAAILLALASRKPTWPVFKHTMLASLKTSAFIMFIAVAGKMLSWVMNYYLIPQNLLNWLLSYNLSGMAIITAVMVLLFFLGMIMDGISIMLITVPVVLPILDHFGYSPIWFAVLFVVNMELGSITPPVGFHLYVVNNLEPRISIAQTLRGTIPFLVADVVCMALVMAFPQLALWLPDRM